MTVSKYLYPAHTCIQPVNVDFRSNLNLNTCCQIVPSATKFTSEDKVRHGSTQTSGISPSGCFTGDNFSNTVLLN